MAAIYRFGFEGASIPAGVTVAQYHAGMSYVSGIVGPSTYESVMANNTVSIQDWFTARYGTYGARTTVTCALSNENGVKGSFELFLGGELAYPMTIVQVGDTLFRLKSANTIDIVTDGIVNAELTVPPVGSYNWYEVRFCYVAGSSGMAIFEWDGNELTFDADPGTPLVGAVTAVYIGKTMPTRFAVDNIAINNDQGGIDDDIPPMTVSYYAKASKAGDSWDTPETSWDTGSATDPVYALNNGGIYASEPGRVANFGFDFETPTNQPFVKVSLEGARFVYGSIRRTGALLDVGAQVGYRIGGVNVPVNVIERVNYSGVSSTFTLLYNQNGEKLTVEDGENLQSYIELIGAQ